MSNRYLPTGNEMISLPTINEETAAIEAVSFLHMGFKGLVEQRGCDGKALIAPFVTIDGVPAPLTNFIWRREDFWIPTFTAQAGPVRVSGIIMAPIEERGFVYHLEVQKGLAEDREVVFGLKGTWASAWHCINEDKKIEGTKHCYHSVWNDSLVFDMRCGTPLFSFAPIMDAPCQSDFLERGDEIEYTLSHKSEIDRGQTDVVNFFWGFGFEEVAATTSAKEMLRQGWEAKLSETSSWLRRRIWQYEGDAELCALYNTNMFFCLFFSTGVTLDTEELVLATSRSPRYYVSAAYWDRDSLFWSFPTVLDVDHALARRMLEYVFGRQRRNIGVHSRYIDGTVLEPGFELDELMAPLLALERYVDATGDTDILEEAAVKAGVQEILIKLERRKNSGAALYETFLQPTDDERVYPYLTYDNVLVWKAFRALSRLYPVPYSALAARAEETRQAVLENCVKAGPYGDFFAWSVDLGGKHDVYDEPPGSLLLLAHLGFCAADDPIYCNTVRMIRSPEYKYSFHGCEIADIGCPHAPHPWLLSVGNSLLSGEVERSLDILKKAPMDNGIICESVDEHTGECATGEAFATCAGFVCHALRTALGGNAI